MSRFVRNIPDTADVNSSFSASEDAVLEPFAPVEALGLDEFDAVCRQYVLHATLGTVHLRLVGNERTIRSTDVCSVSLVTSD